MNAAGAWARNVAQMVGLDVPVAILKHSYILTEPVANVKGTPNIRDNDGLTYYRIMGEAIMLGGYERHPEIVKEVTNM